MICTPDVTSSVRLLRSALHVDTILCRRLGQILLYVRGGDAWAAQSWCRPALGDGLFAGLALCVLLFCVAIVQVRLVLFSCR